MSSTTADAPWHDGNPLDETERLIADGRAAEAADRLRRRIAAGHGGLLARLAYADALDAAGDQAGALAAARETAMLHPGVAAAALGLGKVLLRAEHLPTAIAEFQRALRLDPGLDEARFQLGCAWLAAGEADKAREAFAALPPDTPGLAEKIAHAAAMRARPRSDAGYVRHLFDQFSTDYDVRMLTQLSYRAPQILRRLADLTMPRRESLAVLDLGCGTGLSGAAFKDLAARLDGIDLSPAMIEKARARGLYDSLAVADIEAALPAERYDLALAADTLVYLGDLEPAMRSAANALKPGGFFLFTVEKKDGDGFELGSKRRWRHSQSYLRGLADANGLEVAGLLACTPRMEARAPVEGLAAALRRTSP
ncbi:MAG: methyltransferase domain-containing protein [Alphaproteobacteria bacterium]|nr:methyltransferase domain-containing protein [Alphaproteobacteria bacterium]MDE2629629.1 methyltransferase domain-containing protein [Alphaproteobacteria bacterium]